MAIRCITSHDRTIQLIEKIDLSLEGKTIIELSTGRITEAEALASLLSARGADWIIGAISGYPSSVGEKDLALFTAGRQDVWEKWEDLIKTLGGSSVRVGERAGMVPTLFAALFKTRQGFMFGMIYGGLVCKKAGISLEEFARQLLQSAFYLATTDIFLTQSPMKSLKVRKLRWPPMLLRSMMHSLPSRHWEHRQSYQGLLEVKIGVREQ